MWRGLLIGVLLGIAGCVAPQPESLDTVAAFEIPVPTASDRTELLTLVRQEAEADGLQLYAASDEQLRDVSEAIPQARRTVSATVWRGAENALPEVTIMDGADHLGRAWITFAKGEDTAQAAQFRERLMRRILLRWPETIALPILPGGNIPLARHLIRTPAGYKLDPAYAEDYGVTAAAPQVFKPDSD